MRRALPVLLASALLLPAGAGSQQPGGRQPAAPRLVPKAETALLMRGINDPNFRGLGRILKEPVADPEAWAFARGQALLVAEAGNLLMLRPPRNRGEQPWLEAAEDLREHADGLASALARRDYIGSRAGLAGLANSCNRCHRTFRVEARAVPFAD